MTLRVAAGFAPALLFEDPVQVWTPATLDVALRALDGAQEAMNAGYWIAGALSYEFGALLGGIPAVTAEPLLILGAFRTPARRSLHTADAFRLTAPLARTGFEEYRDRIGYLIRQITDGEVYQVNYTIPFDGGFTGDPFDLYAFLSERSQARYCAFLQHGERALVSISPELFLRFGGDRVTTKPMKGTAALDRIDELSNGKNLAEHVMIVDLLRNDLHRIGSNVTVDRIFEVERYPTFATLTSTISADVDRSASLRDIFSRTFPCGSVTGAPKLAAMQHIAQIEKSRRGFYTGSVGFLSPRRRGWWNVAIRTLQIRGSAARFDAGGGIVSDSQAAQEWEEIRIKSRFLEPAYRGFGLIETFRGGPRRGDVEAHALRLSASARAFALTADMSDIRAKLNRAAEDDRDVLVRAMLDPQGLHVRVEALQEPDLPVDLCMWPHPIHSEDPFLRHKTSWRPAQEAASRYARERSCFDAVLINERKEIAQGARTNIFVQIGNTLYTPPLGCGVLPGILRSALVSQGKAVERVLFAGDLAGARALYAGNSARGLLLARLVK